MSVGKKSTATIDFVDVSLSLEMAGSAGHFLLYWALVTDHRL